MGVAVDMSSCVTACALAVAERLANLSLVFTYSWISAAMPVICGVAMDVPL